MARYKQYSTTKGDRWHVRGYLGTNEATGKQIEFERRGFKTRKEAQVAYTRAKSQFDKGIYGDSIKSVNNLTYEDVFNEWIVLYRETVKESTAVKTEEIFDNHVLPTFGKYKINKIKPAILQKELNNWHKKFATYSKIYNYTCKVFAYAVQQGYISSNPKDKIVKPTKKIEYKTAKKREKSFYSKDELQEVLKVIEKTDNGRWYAFFRLLSFSGLRKGEALALSWKDIDFEANTLSVKRTLTHGYNNELIIQTPKTDSSIRTITLDPKTISVLAKWRMEQRQILLKFGHNANKSNQLVFSKYEKNTPLDLSTPRNYFARVCEANNLDFINIHGFRHTHCSLLFEAGVPMKDVKERLGHSDIKTTMNVYTHVTEKSKNKSAELFANYANF